MRRDAAGLAAARRIQTAWRAYVDKKIFEYIKKVLTNKLQRLAPFTECKPVEDAQADEPGRMRFGDVFVPHARAVSVGRRGSAFLTRISLHRSTTRYTHTDLYAT